MRRQLAPVRQRALLPRTKSASMIDGLAARSARAFPWSRYLSPASLPVLVHARGTGSCSASASMLCRR